MGYSKEEWAQFAKNRRREAGRTWNDEDEFEGVGPVCINCGAPVGSNGQIGEDAAICAACD